MPIQTGAGFVVNFKVEGTEGVAATGGAATGERLRVLDSPGLGLRRGIIRSEERRDDANLAPPRLGGKRVEGSHNVELSQGSFDTLIEALMRSTWVAATNITEAAMTSITTTTSTIVAAAGSWITQGVRVGDVVRLTGHATAANNDINLLVTGVTASTITVAGTPLTLNASPDTAFTLTIQKKIAQATTPTRRTFTLEEYFEDMDVSEQFTGCRLVSASIQFQPNSMATATLGWVGLNRTALATGASPYFMSPTEYTSIALVVDDASIRYNGATITTLTGVTVNFSIAATVEPVVGSITPPGSFDARMEVSGECMGMISDLSDLTLYDAETLFELNVLLVAPEAEPKAFLNFFFPAVKIVDIDRPLGGDSALIQRRQLAFTPKVATTGYNVGVCTISTGT